MRAGGRQGKGERSRARRDMDENAPLRAGTDMIMEEPLVVVHHSSPLPGCWRFSLKLLLQHSSPQPYPEHREQTFRSEDGKS